MKIALREAAKAGRKKEIPIGAVIVKDGKVLACAHNLRERRKNVLCHAEVLAISRACRKLKSWRLTGCDIYVTLEPCAMCAGAIAQSRISNLYFGALDPKTGACGSLVDVLKADRLTHNVSVTAGVLAEECSEILKDFFNDLRRKKL